MADPDPTTPPLATSRRGLVKGSTTAGLLALTAGVLSRPGVASASPHNPDALLIALCAAFDETEHHYQGLHGVGPRAHLQIADDDALDIELERLESVRGRLIDRICAESAVTLEGFKARARSLALYDGKLLQTDRGHHPDRMMGALLRDLVGWAA